MRHSKSSHLHTQNRSSERGNVFLFIILGIVLFATLTYTVSRGFQSQSANSGLTEKEAILVSTDILTYAQRVERAVNKLRRRGTSESDISFVNSGASGYEHATPQPDSNRIFNPAGASLAYSAPSLRWLNASQSAAAGYGQWYFTGQMAVQGVGSANSDIVLVLPYVTRSVCQAINDALSITDIPRDDGVSTTLNTSNQYTGSNFGTSVLSDAGAVLDNQNAGCFEGGTTPAEGTFHFYYVLIAR